MKYWNKNKDVRIRCWTKVKRDNKVPRFPYALLKRELQNDPSTGKFYMYHASDYIWFERPEDAVLFALRWS